MPLYQLQKPTRTGMGLNPCLRVERPTNNRLSRDTFPLCIDELDRMRVEVVVACLKVLATWTFI
jgi:hypothetical protein